jgi:hypothetical protein
MKPIPAIPLGPRPRRAAEAVRALLEQCKRNTAARPEEDPVNNVKPSTREQGYAGEFLSQFYDSVLVNTPNAFDNVTMIGLDGDREAMTWIVHPSGRLIHSSDWEHVATREYMQSVLG